jgi:hypothetical protein
LAALLAITLLMTFAAIPALPVRAAIDLEYFNAIASSSAVLLEWSTASEFNVAGFEVLKKKAGEPESSFNRIGFYNAKGDTTSGAQYDTLVTHLTAGAAYCFRLREITTDDEPGEVRDLCGYGLSITPTPVSAAPTSGPAAGAIAAATSGAVLFPTPTLDPLLPTPTLDPFAQQQFPTPDPFAQQSPLPTPTFDPFAQAAQPAAQVDPFATPTLDPFAPMPTVDPFAQPTPTFDPFAQPTATIDPFAQPTVDPFAQPTPTFDPFAQPTVDPFAQPTATVDPFAQPAAIDPVTGWQIDPATGYPINPATGLPTDPATAALIVQQPQSPLQPPTETPGLVPTATSHFAGAEVVAADATPSPTSIYIIVTAAPAGVSGNEGIAAVVTPWPTVMPAPAPLLGALFMPTAQNLTVLMLCFIFLSATALGGLGLMTVVLYLRSRNQREEDRARLRARHQTLL